MTNGGDQATAIVEAEAALDAGSPDRTMEVLSPFFQSGLQPRALWLVARVLTTTEQTAQACELFKQAFNGDNALPFIEIRVGDTVCRIQDVAGSLSLVTFAEEFYRDIYGLADLGLGPGDAFIDVGANVGFVSIAVASRYPDARVIAFEPAPKTFEILEKNIHDNGIANITAVNKAVNADGRDLELLVMHGDSGASNAFTNATVAERYESENIGELVRVEALSLDAVFDEYSIDRCAFLKLDCEGAEFEVLRTTEKLDRIDRISMELHIDLQHLEDTTPDAFAADFCTEICARVAQPPEIKVASLVGVRDT